jgi:hypothetical protein
MSVTIQDYRRTDLRMDVSGDPFWIVSRIVDGHEVSGLKGKACVLFSFPVAGQQVVISEIVVRITRAFTTGTTLELGTYTLATDDVETGGVATELYDDAYVRAVDILPSTVGWYYPTAGDFTDARGSGVTVNGSNLIVGASTTVPAIVLTPKVATIIIGQVQVLMLVCIVPGS